MRSPLLLLAAVMFACGTRPPLATTDEDAGLTLDAGAADAGVPDAGAVDAGVPDAGEVDAGIDAGLADLDLDGLDDAIEAQLAAASLPVLGVHPSDACARSGLLYRARKHPLDPTLVFIVYVHLFERDCGLTSHVGDDEVFAVTVNPSVGVTAMRAISHQGTLCERRSDCGTCNGASACETSSGRPIVYFSKDKHAAYVSRSACGTLTCLDQCASGDRQGIPLVNAGEPNAPLTEDLTDAGFITAANGWTEASLLHFNPWGGAKFGGAGSVTSDLTDPAFDTPACR